MIVVAGEALVDLVAEEDGRYRAVPGGSPANVAVGLSRLGVRTHMLARLGTGNLLGLFQLGTLPGDLTRRNMELFAKEVMPAVRKAFPNL